MWFNPSALETPALQKIKKYNANKVEIEMASYCYEVMDGLGQNQMRFCPKDLVEVMREYGLRAEINMVRNILKDNWGLASQKNSEYIFYRIDMDGEIIPVKRKGRYMEVALTEIEKILL